MKGTTRQGRGSRNTLLSRRKMTNWRNIQTGMGQNIRRSRGRARPARPSTKALEILRTSLRYPRRCRSLAEFQLINSTCTSTSRTEPYGPLIQPAMLPHRPTPSTVLAAPVLVAPPAPPALAAQNSNPPGAPPTTWSSTPRSPHHPTPPASSTAAP